MRERDLRKGCLFTFLVAMLLVSVDPAWASIAPLPVVRIEWGEGSFWERSYTDEELAHLGGDYFSVVGSRQDSFGNAEWDVEFDADPYVIAEVSMLNDTDSLQTYTITVAVPVSPSLMSPTVHGGSTSGSFSTDPGGGTIATVDPEPLYWGMIDGVGVLGLYPHESSWSRVSGGTTEIPLVEAGLPPSLASGAVIDTIAIQYNFSLTPGDAVAFTGYFEVVPEPATLAILGLGGMVILGRKRR